MSFDSRLRDALRQATDAHDLRDGDALQAVLATRADRVRIAGLEDVDPPRRVHARSQRIVGAVAACALLAGALAIPLAVRDRSRDAAPPAAGSSSSGARYRSTVTIRVAEAPSSPSPSIPPTVTSTTPAPRVTLTDPRRLALLPATRKAALVASRLRPADTGVGFAVSLNAAGDTLGLIVTAPTRAAAQTVARNWAGVVSRGRIADAQNRVRARQHALSVRVTELHRELERVDKQLVTLMPVVYKGVLEFDAPGAGLPGRTVNRPPPVPQQGSVKALNLAFERIQLLSSLTESGTQAAQLRIAVVKPDVVATIITQTPAVRVGRAHRSWFTAPTFAAAGLVAGGLALLGAAFWLGRRSRGLRLGGH